MKYFILFGLIVFHYFCMQSILYDPFFPFFIFYFFLERAPFDVLCSLYVVLNLNITCNWKIDKESDKYILL